MCSTPPRSGIVIEGVADHQLRRFRREQERRGDGASATCDRGLWQWSRHPNYCGECTFWTGLLGFGISSGAVAAEPALAIGAPLMWAFFRFASVPLMDDRSLERGRRGYEAMMQTTSPLLEAAVVATDPRPGQLGRHAWVIAV